jgi:hypothetical protein
MKVKREGDHRETVDIPQNKQPNERTFCCG